MLTIYYRDRDLAVCEKPRGVLSEGETADAMPALLAATLTEDGRVPQVYPVHRLDRETEGIMVYALTEKAAAQLSAQFAAREVTKEYLATVHGQPEETEGEMVDLLFFDRTRNRSYTVTRMRRGVKEARLRYRVLAIEGRRSRVAVRLGTGRTHQIRVQFASRRMPLVGDRKYGAPATGEPLALRACFLSFAHPVTGEALSFGESCFEA